VLRFFYHFRYENVVKLKKKRAPATLKKCSLSVLTISSPPQSREAVPLKTLYLQILNENLSLNTGIALVHTGTTVASFQQGFPSELRKKFCNFSKNSAFLENPLFSLFLR